MSRLSKEDRERAIGRLQVGQRKRQDAQRFGCTVRTIYRLWHRFKQTGSTSDPPRSSRPPVTTPGGPSCTATSSTGQVSLRHGHRKNLPGRRISAQTVRNRLNSSHLRARRPYTGPVLTRRHRSSRLNWARTHRRWLLRQWNNIMFSDESRFCLTHGDVR